MESSSFIMKVLLLLPFFLHFSSAGTHSLQYFYTGVTPGTNFPEFIAVGLVDGEPFTYYDSNIRKKIPKAEWMEKVTTDEPDYWNRDTQNLQTNQEVFKVNVEIAKQRFNHSAGLHLVQEMYGCELDDDGSIRGFEQYGYDGADFLSLDLKTLTWTAANQKALITKMKWDGVHIYTQYVKHYLEKECIDWLKKYVSYGKETLERKDPPEASLFQKNSPSPELVCHATGFFPKVITISWQKNGEDVDEDVELLETLPNNDGSFQKRNILRVSPEELQKHDYTCVIQHSSMKEDLVLKASERRILSGTHSLQYFYTALTPGTNFPEFTAVGLVDGEQINYYDSNIKKMIPKMEWMKKVTDDDPDYLNRGTQILQKEQENLEANVATLMQRFHQTAGVHVMQWMYGCEIVDGSIRGFDQYGYDGADFISLDLKTLTWTAANKEALITKHKWDAAGEATRRKDYLEKECIEWLKKFVSYGKDTLERKDPPEASLVQKLSSSPELVCHATGFFPKVITISWQKNGEDVDEDVEVMETLPNNDGSFQKRNILRVSPEELQKHDYTCVIQHSSMKEDLVLKAGERPILSGPDGGSIGIIVGAKFSARVGAEDVSKVGAMGGAMGTVMGSVVVGLIVLVLCAAGILIWKKKRSDYRPAPSRAGSGGDSASSGS